MCSVGILNKNWWCIVLPKGPRLYIEGDEFEEIAQVAKIIAKKERRLLIRVSKSELPQKLIPFERVTLSYSTPADPRPEVIGPITVYMEGSL